LIDAAESLLDKTGDISLREAARAAQVSPAAAYRHFADKDALLAAVAIRGFQAFGAALDEAAAHEPDNALAARGRAYIRFALARPGRFRLMFGPLLSRAADHPDLLQASRQTFAALEQVTGNTDDALRRWSMVHGLAHLLLDGAHQTDDVDTLLERLVR
jgi:AcrR family transcriptional regulator